MNNPDVEVAVGCLNIQTIAFQRLVQIPSYPISVSREVGREKGAITLTPFDENVLDVKPLPVRVANEDRGEMPFLSQ